MVKFQGKTIQHQHITNICSNPRSQWWGHRTILWKNTTSHQSDKSDEIICMMGDMNAKLDQYHIATL